MYWKVTTLTKMGAVVDHSFKGSRQEVLDQLEFNGMDIIGLQADYKKDVEEFFKKGKLSSSVLSFFFKDFSRSFKSGLSAQETITSLGHQTSHLLLKETLKKINMSIIDGYSFRESFENTKAFPPIVLSALDAAERSGQLAQVAQILSEYFKFVNDNKIKLIKSLIYPASVFVALTVASIVISIKLVPQLSIILPAHARDNVSAHLILGYADFMQSHWLLVLLAFLCGIMAGIKTWKEKKAVLMKHVFRVPLLGDLIKEMELTVIFLNLYVYQKAGVNIMASLTHIYSNQPNYVTQRLKEIKKKVHQGYSLAEAFKADDFFPSLISMSIKKGESTGNLYQYFHEIYQYYDQKSRDSIETLITFINPALLALAVSYLGLIIGCFILPLYSSMNGAGSFR